jgi:CheY-like chemotaxis protein
VKILIVDDEIHVATMLAEAVTRLGHQVAVAHDGEEALALWEDFQPDAVFLDVKLRELTGIDVLRYIRRRDSTIPVVVITGHAASWDIQEARQLGITDVLEKPFVLNHLTHALAALDHES